MTTPVLRTWSRISSSETSLSSAWRLSMTTTFLASSGMFGERVRRPRTSDFDAVALASVAGEAADELLHLRSAAARQQDGAAPLKAWLAFGDAASGRELACKLTQSGDEPLYF